MEFFDDDRPRFLFQSRPLPPPPTHPETQRRASKPLVFFAISVSSLFLALSFFYVQTEPFKSLLIWLALSLVAGPFAPSSLTGGDIHVGQGPVVEFADPEPKSDDDSTKKRKPKQRRSECLSPSPAPVLEAFNGSAREDRKSEVCESGNDGSVLSEEKDWTEEDFEFLKKQLLKHPVGTPRRWEVIAEAFNGRHKLENVIKKAKELGEKKWDDGDSYAKFLKNRKPVDKRLESENANSNDVTWSAGDDVALLNALKAFPKDVAMRWEKIAAAVPGKTKAACMKRFSELKKEFRSSKAGNEG